MFAVTNRSKAEYKIPCIMFLKKVPGKTDGCRYILPQQPPEEFMTKKKTKKQKNKYNSLACTFYRIVLNQVGEEDSVFMYKIDTF